MGIWARLEGGYLGKLCQLCPVVVTLMWRCYRSCEGHGQGRQVGTTSLDLSHFALRKNVTYSFLVGSMDSTSAADPSSESGDEVPAGSQE